MPGWTTQEIDAAYEQAAALAAQISSVLPPFRSVGRRRHAGRVRSRPKVDLTGQRYGLLVVVKQAPTHKGRTGWVCDCDCGSRVVVSATALQQGAVDSCGVMDRELWAEEHDLDEVLSALCQRQLRCDLTAATRNRIENLLSHQIGGAPTDGD